MKRTRLYITLVLMLSSVSAVVAQEKEQSDDNISRTIVIQKEVYMGVEAGERIERPVEVLDTTIQRPVLDYRIFPTAHNSEFTVQSLTPIEMSAARWVRPSQLYLKVGGGLPLQSELDTYWSPVSNDDMQLSLWANHEGELGKARGYDSKSRRVRLARNQAGLNFFYDVAPVLKVNSYVKYRGSLGSYYGGVGDFDSRPCLSVHDVEGKVNLSGSFGQESPFSYDANIMGLYASNALEEDVWRFNVNYGFVGLDDVKGWLPGRVTLHYSGVQSTCAEPYYDTSITFVPEWSLRLGEWVPVDIVAGYDYMVYKGAKNTLDGVIASISTAYDKFPELIPYAKVSNDVQTQVTRTGLWENPFMAMLPVDTRKVFLTEVGFKGDSHDFSYRISGSTRWFSSYFYEVVTEGTPVLAYGRNNGQRVWYMEADMLWRPEGNISVSAGVKRTALGSADSSTDYYRPRTWRGNVEVEFHPENYDRLSVVASTQWANRMEVTQRGVNGSSVLTMPGYIDLGVRVSWRYTENMDFWLRADNLLCQPIYEWATYRALGIGFRGGVRMSF